MTINLPSFRTGFLPSDHIFNKIVHEWPLWGTREKKRGSRHFLEVLWDHCSKGVNRTKKKKRKKENPRGLFKAAHANVITLSARFKARWSLRCKPSRGRIGTSVLATAPDSSGEVGDRRHSALTQLQMRPGGRWGCVRGDCRGRASDGGGREALRDVAARFLCPLPVRGRRRPDSAGPSEPVPLALQFSCTFSLRNDLRQLKKIKIKSKYVFDTTA